MRAHNIPVVAEGEELVALVSEKEFGEESLRQLNIRSNLSRFTGKVARKARLKAKKEASKNKRQAKRKNRRRR